MKVGKPKSKRVPVRLRHKIEKASAAKQRKDRKQAKKNPQWRSRLKKDPGIPNLFPFKDKVLAEIEESRRKKEEEVQRRREVAKAQRLGTAVAHEDSTTAGALVVDEDEALIDPEDLSDDDEAMDEDEQNPMAALLASAQARAHNFSKDTGNDAEGGNDEDDEDDEDDSEEEWTGVQDTNGVKKGGPTRKMLPRQAIDEPIKAVSLLLERLSRSSSNGSDGMQVLLDHYQIPPLVTAGSDATTRFLVEVARKRGRLGRGGVPNLPAAALTVLGDLNDERLQLPALTSKPASDSQPSTITSADKGAVRIVSQMAEPFRIEGLFGDELGSKKVAQGTEMEVEA